MITEYIKDRTQEILKLHCHHDRDRDRDLHVVCRVLTNFAGRLGRVTENLCFDINDLSQSLPHWDVLPLSFH